MSAKHEVFVLSSEGKPLTPTTSARARKLLKAGAAKKAWSKFNTFGIQLLTETRQETPLTTLGYDAGTKFEGFAVVCGNENVLSVKLDLPDKKQIVRKLDERRSLRRSRRFRKTRRRPARFDNRTRPASWLAPSQRLIVQSRLKVLGAFFALYPIAVVGLEDVRFNHAKHRWGANFSTAEIGKRQLMDWLEDRATLMLFEGWQTQELRKGYGYRKTTVKNADKFTAHCSDALALACEVGVGEFVKPGRFLVVDDTYRPVRRKLHDTQPAKGGVRAKYSTGTVFGLRKGLRVGLKTGESVQLCGENRGSYRFYRADGRRGTAKQIHWTSSQFITKGGKRHSPPA